MYFYSTSVVFAGLMLSPVSWHIHSMQRSGFVCRRNHLIFEFQLSNFKSKYSINGSRYSKLSIIRPDCSRLLEFGKKI